MARRTLDPRPITDAETIAHRDMIHLGHTFLEVRAGSKRLTEEEADDLRGRLEFIIDTYQESTEETLRRRLRD